MGVSAPACILPVDDALSSSSTTTDLRRGIKSSLAAWGARAVGALTVMIILGATLHDLTWRNGMPFSDAGAFATIGTGILHGKIPYLQMWDHKPPGIFYIDAFIYGILHLPPWDVHLVELPVALATAAAFFWMMRALVPRLPAAGATLLFAYFLAAQPLTQGGGLTESYLTLPIVIAFGLGFRLAGLGDGSRMFARGSHAPLTLAAIGLCCAAAALLKPQSLADLTLLEVTLAVSWWGQCARRTLALLSIPPAIVVAAGAAMYGYFAMHGAGSAFWAQVVVYNSAYARAVGPAAALQLLLLNPAGLILWGLTAVAVAVVIPSARPLDVLRRRVAADRTSTILLLWCLLGVAETSFDRHVWFHDFLLSLPSAAALIGYALACRPEQDRPRTRTNTVLYRVLLVSLAIFALLPLGSLLDSASSIGRLALYSGNNPAAWSLRNRSVHPTAYAVAGIGPWTIAVRAALPGDDELVAEKIVALTRPTDSVFIWGQPTSAYFLSGRRPASRFLYYMPLVNVYGNTHVPGPEPGYLQAELLQDLAASRPRLMVVSSPEGRYLSDVPALQRLIHEQYHRVMVVPSNLGAGKFVFYVRTAS